MDAALPYDRTERVGGHEAHLLLHVTDSLLLIDGCDLFRHRDGTVFRTFDNIENGVDA